MKFREWLLSRHAGKSLQSVEITTTKHSIRLASTNEDIYDLANLIGQIDAFIRVRDQDGKEGRSYE